MIDLNSFEKGLEKTAFSFFGRINTKGPETDPNKKPASEVKAETNEAKSVGSTLAKGKGTMSRNLRAWMKRNPVKSVAGGVLAGAGLGAMIFSQASKPSEDMQQPM